MPKTNTKANKATERQDKANVPNFKVTVTGTRDNETHVKGFADVEIADSIMIHSVAIVEGENGLFASLPSRKYQDANGDTQYAEICHPTNGATRAALNEKVVEAYKQKLAEKQENKADIEQNAASEEADESEATAEDLDEDDGLVPVQ
jgi:stage V sporulation protein G